MYVAPWRRDWADLSPVQFEEAVVEWLRMAFGAEGLQSFTVEHQARMEDGAGIHCRVDALVRFELAGMVYTTVVECKHQVRPVEGEVVDVLAAKVDRHGHKGMLISTGGFQRGALERAEQRGIALVHITSGGAKAPVRPAGLLHSRQRTRVGRARPRAPGRWGADAHRRLEDRRQHRGPGNGAALRVCPLLP
jgi:hypothetical protein